MTNSLHRFRRFAPTLLVIAGSIGAFCAQISNAQAQSAPPTAKPALAVTVTRPQPATLPIRVPANGNIAAWQEASIGTEANGLRLTEVRVNVGDRVRRGQVLASFEAAPVATELAQSRAALAESEAALAEAAANAQRARELQASGALSAQQIHQYVTAERMAQARSDAARAVARTQELRLAQTQVRAPDDGVISTRSATVGAVLPAGQELFRLIRRSRLEWRAEVAAPQLARLRPGQGATVTPVGGEPIQGSVRMVAPAVDTQTRNGLVYVDLPAGDAARAGMFARGEIEVGPGSPALTLPQAVVLQREGFDYVLRVGPDSRVVQTRVKLGRRAGDRVEVLSGIDAASTVVATGGGFLGDGDLVDVVEGRPAVGRAGLLATERRP
ncbi:efflux transporter periplasmic adaptor subunit [Methylibium sp. Pch-M]|jgi:RND family efflux transporter MFP subunit|uniref:efflux RND transporter periplasmic adaptor subunit n=1 Tax=Methylibium sp. Pch-M TaxID=2082386 RepID=UPI0010123799|nr:efflux RND transporter periplasmic adaptor subunit [Methylibium sp. Pch-M]QAZ39096.1 efflux transporter periplasmic adaptor subunit [Methylibium sp. Pch-M]